MSFPRSTVVLLLCLAFAALPSTGRATTTSQVEVVCPVCVASFTAPQLMSTNSFGGQDTDFMTRARGSQPLLLAPITCVICAYSGYLDEFIRPAYPDRPAPTLGEGVTTAIRQEKRLQPAVPLPASGTFESYPVWARYDLIAQVYALTGQGDRKIARQYQNAAYTCRLDIDEYIHTLEPAQSEAMKTALDAAFAHTDPKVLEAHGGNQATYEVEVADRLLETARAATTTPDLGSLLGAFLLLRIHGENTGVLAAFALLKPLLKPEQTREWDTRLTEDLARERAFQVKAADGLAKAAELADNPAEKAGMRYHAGELYRRLEQWDKARLLFDQVRGDPNLPDFLKIFLAFVEKRLPKP